jgi:hypothetical protein|nr:MAG: hypothetical protein [Bacteriophage sp.]
MIFKRRKENGEKGNRYLSSECSTI